MEAQQITNQKIMNWFSTRGGGGVVAPAVLTDGNTVAWYDYQESVTKDASDRVSVWGDKSGLSHDLLQAVGADQPLYTADGILFDGVSNALEKSFVLIQPEFIYIVLKQVTWTLNKGFFDGFPSTTGLVYQNGTTPQIEAFAGSGSGKRSDLAVGSYGIIRVLFNGASSKFIVNENTPTTGDFGVKDMEGFKVGRYGSPNYSNVEIKEVIIRKVADAAADEQAIYDYLASKYSIS